MTTTETIEFELPYGDDSILPFELRNADMRGRLARLDGAMDRLFEHHNYPDQIAGLVAEAAMITALIGQSLKLRWRISLQIRGKDAIHLVATDYFAPTKEGEPAKIRAYAGYDPEQLDETADAFSQFGKGAFGVIIDQGSGMQPYQGIAPLTGGSLSASAEAYFAQSEQLPTRFKVLAAETIEPDRAPSWRAGAMMLQQLPKSSKPVNADGPSGDDGLMTGDDVAAMSGDEAAENWSRVNMLLDTVEPHELLGPTVTPESLLIRLFSEEEPVVYEPQKLDFGCTCSAEKVVGALAQYGKKDIGHMTNDDGKVTADCQFCGRHYEFEPHTLGFERTAEPDLTGK